VPELPEVEAYRLLADARALGRPIAVVHAPDAWILKRGLSADVVTAALTGRAFTRARRRGKLLLLDTDGVGGGDGPVLGLRFGMTGRLVVDDRAGVDELLYSSHRDDRAWDRFWVTFADGGHLRLHDPRRLGGVELDPDEDRLGPDARSITPAEVRTALAGSDVALKARLMDQRHIAGIGNLLADEILWRAGLSPLRPAGSLTAAEVRRLHRHLTTTVEDLVAGGSHTGRLMVQRRPGGVCPRDGAPLVRSTVGGRTTWWCGEHQK
jgi:formamidopyrimidine-DNA glycosylase